MAPSKPNDPVLHGVLVLHARSGAIVFSQRATPAFGLSSCETLARDELRFGAMLFALHLNAAAACASETAEGLTAYDLDGVSLRFCTSATSDLLLVLFAPAALGPQAAGFFAADLLRRFEEACIAAAGGQKLGAVRQGMLKRSAFAPILRDATGALHAWCLTQALEQASRLVLPSSSSPQPSASSKSGPRLDVRNVASLHSAGICDALSAGPSEDVSAASSTSTGDAPDGAAARRTRDSKRPQQRASGARSLVAPTASPPLPLLTMAGLPAPLNDDATARRRSCLLYTSPSPRDS